MTIAPGQTVLAGDILGLAVASANITQSGSLTITLDNGTQVAATAPGPILLVADLGVDGQVLTSNGPSLAPTFQDSISNWLAPIVESTGTGLVIQSEVLSVDPSAVQFTSSKGSANGYAPLNGNAKVPLANLPTLVTSVNSATGDVVLNAGNLPGLGPISTLSIGSGLVSSSGSLAVVIDSSLRVSGNQIGVATQTGTGLMGISSGTAQPTLQAIGSGLSLSGGTLSATGTSISAGQGLTNTAGTLSVNIDSSLSFTSGTIGIAALTGPAILGVPTGSTSQPVSVTVGTGLALSGGSLVATGTSVASGNLSGPATGNWQFGAGAANQIFLFKDSSGNILFEVDTGSPAIISGRTHRFQPNTTINQAGFTFSTSSAMYQNLSWTGAITGTATAITQNYIGGSSAISNVTQYSILNIVCTMGVGAVGNSYAIDLSANQAGISGGTNELHGIRAGAVQNYPTCSFVIGIKPSAGAASTLTGGAGTQLAIETLIANNATISVPNIFGQWFEDGSANNATTVPGDYTAIAIVSSSVTGGVAPGWKTGISFGAKSRGTTGPQGSFNPFTCIYGTGPGGAAFPFQNFIDMSLGSIASNGFWHKYGTVSAMDAFGNMWAESFGVNGSTGPTWTAGNGAPAGTAPNGSLYSRQDGTSGSRLYVSTGSAWNAVAGV